MKPASHHLFNIEFSGTRESGRVRYSVLQCNAAAKEWGGVNSEGIGESASDSIVGSRGGLTLRHHGITLIWSSLYGEMILVSRMSVRRWEGSANQSSPETSRTASVQAPSWTIRTTHLGLVHFTSQVRASPTIRVVPRDRERSLETAHEVFEAEMGTHANMILRCASFSRVMVMCDSLVGRQAVSTLVAAVMQRWILWQAVSLSSLTASGGLSVLPPVAMHATLLYQASPCIQPRLISRVHS
jgi:hypothetical protein